MVSVENGLLQIMLASPPNTVYWLIGTDFHAINMIPLIPIEEAKALIPGGLDILGQFYSSDQMADYLKISRDLNLNPAMHIVKQNEICISYIVEGPLLSQKDICARETPQFTVLFSHSVLPVFSLTQPNCFSYINRTVLFQFGTQYVELSNEPTWNSLGIKGQSLTPVQILYKLTEEGDGNAPLLEILPQTRSYSLDIYWCSAFKESKSLVDALETHLDKLKEIAMYIINCLKENPTKSASCYCFYNDYCSHPFNVIYLFNEWEEEGEELLAQRRRIHELLRFPMDWPLVRSYCTITEPQGLRDIHLPLLKRTSKDVGTKYCVRGHYSYFHYSQDGFDDRGWGCAYRSLQTLISWIREQKFISKEIPSHYQIQKILEEAGDKPKEFIGSKEWIGAFEVMLILDLYCGITCKIMNLASGAEFSSKGRELAAHFTDEGSPVMIGGGVLAYTLLGVDYNEDTGDTRFLILDPHYTGADVPKTILDKGWCAWKSADIFRQDSFYNLCLPQRPRYI